MSSEESPVTRAIWLRLLCGLAALAAGIVAVVIVIELVHGALA